MTKLGFLLPGVSGDQTKVIGTTKDWGFPGHPVHAMHVQAFFQDCVPIIPNGGFVVTTQRVIQTLIRVELIFGFLGFLLTLPLAGADIPVKSTSDQPPRKVIVGTVMQPFWGKHPGLEKRLDQVTAIVDRMQVESEKKYGRGLDLAVLPEMAVTGEGERVGEVADW